MNRIEHGLETLIVNSRRQVLFGGPIVFALAWAASRGWVSHQR